MLEKYSYLVETKSPKIVSEYIVSEIVTLIIAFKLDGRNVANLFEHVLPEHFVDVEKNMSESDKITYIRYLMKRYSGSELVKEGFDPNLVVRACPDIPFEEKVNMGAFANVIADTTKRLSLKEAGVLLDRGADRYKVEAKTDGEFSTEFLVEHGVSPNAVVYWAMDEGKHGLIRSHIEKLLKSGLWAESLIGAEIESIDKSERDYDHIIGWYMMLIDELDLLGCLENDGKGLPQMLIKLVRKVRKVDKRVKVRDTDETIVIMIRSCISNDIISFDKAVKLVSKKTKLSDDYIRYHLDPGNYK